MPQHDTPSRTGHFAGDVNLPPLPGGICLPPPPDLQQVIVERDEFKIRLADTDGQRSSSSLLIKRMYSWRGYESEGPDTPPSNLVTLVAYSNDAAERAIGTITLCFDCATGLPADGAYADRLDELRAAGCRLCEPGSLAVDPAALGSKPLLAALFHLTTMYIHDVQHYTDLVVQVNPRHSLFYQRMLGFSQIGDVRTCRKVNAPAVLLRVTTAYMKQQSQKYGGLGSLGRTRSLYPYFFSDKEEKGLIGRLWSQRGATQALTPHRGVGMDADRAACEAGVGADI